MLLGLDFVLVAFLAENQLIGGEPSTHDFELVDEEDGSTHLMMTAKFIGTDIEFAESFSDDAERFTVSAFDVMKKFGISEPQDIFSYIRFDRSWTYGFRNFRKDLIGH